MKHHKKALAAMITGAVLCGCAAKEETLPVPAFPLEQESVTAALADAGLSWSIGEEQSWAENQKVYDLNDEEGRKIAILITIGEDSSRAMSLTFLSEMEDSSLIASLPQEDIEKAFILSAVVYGGFESREEVYEAYEAHYSEEAVVKEQDSAGMAVPLYEEITDWQGEVNGISCYVSMGRREADSEQELRQIWLYNDEAYAPI